MQARTHANPSHHRSAASYQNWLVIDRLSCMSATAELLIELAVARTSQKPTIIVIDSVERLHGYDSETTDEQVSTEHICATTSVSRVYPLLLCSPLPAPPVVLSQLGQIDTMKNSAIPIGSGTAHKTVAMPWLYRCNPPALPALRAPALPPCPRLPPTAVTGDTNPDTERNPDPNPNPNLVDVH